MSTKILSPATMHNTGPTIRAKTRKVPTQRSGASRSLLRRKMGLRKPRYARKMPAIMLIPDSNRMPISLPFIVDSCEKQGG